MLFMYSFLPRKWRGVQEAGRAGSSGSGSAFDWPRVICTAAISGFIPSLLRPHTAPAVAERYLGGAADGVASGARLEGGERTGPFDKFDKSSEQPGMFAV